MFAVKTACGAISGFFNTLFPQARPAPNAGGRNPNAERVQQALNGNRQNLLNPYDMNNYRQGAPGGFNLNDLQQFRPLNDNTPNFRPQAPAVFVPNEGHVEMLMVRHTTCIPICTECLLTGYGI